MQTKEISGPAQQGFRAKVEISFMECQRYWNQMSILSYEQAILFIMLKDCLVPITSGLNNGQVSS